MNRRIAGSMRLSVLRFCGCPTAPSKSALSASRSRVRWISRRPFEHSMRISSMTTGHSISKRVTEMKCTYVLREKPSGNSTNLILSGDAIAVFQSEAITVLGRSSLTILSVYANPHAAKSRLSSKRPTSRFPHSMREIFVREYLSFSANSRCDSLTDFRAKPTNFPSCSSTVESHSCIRNPSAKVPFSRLVPIEREVKATQSEILRL